MSFDNTHSLIFIPVVDWHDFAIGFSIYTVDILSTISENFKLIQAKKAPCFYSNIENLVLWASGS